MQLNLLFAAFLEEIEQILDVVARFNTYLETHYRTVLKKNPKKTTNIYMQPLLSLAGGNTVIYTPRRALFHRDGNEITSGWWKLVEREET